MNVFTDFHHSALLRSLIILFEDRLGGQVYRPIGTEWAEQGFWKVYDHPATVQQYLTLAQGYRPIDGTPPLNKFVEDVKLDDPDLYICADPESESYNKAITLEKFKTMKFDIVIASIPAHIAPFKKLIELYQPQAKLVFQVGNAWDYGSMDVQNVLASTKPVEVPDHIHAVFYHQEFDLNIFKPEPFTKSRAIHSFVNILQGQAVTDFLKLEELLPDFTLKSYGAGNRDGIKNGVKEMARGINDADWVLHVKPGGDGYGHVIHNAFACGRPVITRKSDYLGCLAGDLMIDGVTCFDLDVHGTETVASLIRATQDYKNKPWLEEMGAAAHARFREVVNFDREEKEIKEWLTKLR